MFVGCGVGGSTAWVQGSGVEGVGIIAVRRPNTNVEVEGVAGGGVGGGNI